MTSVNYRAVVERATCVKEVSMRELRDRMEQDLILHGMSPRTQQSYLAAVRGLATYYHHQPDTLRGSPETFTQRRHSEIHVVWMEQVCAASSEYC